MAAQDLEARIKVLEDIEAIRKLKAKYCFFIDAWNTEELMKLFTEDAKILMVSFGDRIGKAAIARFFKEVFPKQQPFTMHMGTHNPLIEVKGEKATGEWYFEVPATYGPTNRAIWIAGKYEDEYVKEGGEWKIKTVAIKFKYVTPYDEGWVKTKMYEEVRAEV